MTMPMAIARFARGYVNPVASHVAGRLPPFAMIRHVGRRSGTEYRTPIMIFRTPDGFVIALTYGPGTDWVRNMFATGAATIQYRGLEIEVKDLRLTVGTEAGSWLPWVVRVALRVMRVDDFLVVRAAGAARA